MASCSTPGPPGATGARQNRSTHGPATCPERSNAPFTGNLDPATGRFRSREELAARYRSLGVGPDDDVVVYCGSGVSACHDLLALEAAGFDAARARLYPGSWSQWAADPTRPVATGGDPAD